MPTDKHVQTHVSGMPSRCRSAGGTHHRQDWRSKLRVAQELHGTFPISMRVHGGRRRERGIGSYFRAVRANGLRDRSPSRRKVAALEVPAPVRRRCESGRNYPALYERRDCTRIVLTPKARSAQFLTYSPQALRKLRVDGPRANTSPKHVFRGRYLGYIAILTVHSAHPAQLIAGGAPHLRRCALLDGLEVATLTRRLTSGKSVRLIA